MKKRMKPEEIVAKVREAEVDLGKGVPVEEVCRKLDVSEATLFRPSGAQVALTGGRWANPDSSRKPSHAFRRFAFFSPQASAPSPTSRLPSRPVQWPGEPGADGSSRANAGRARHDGGGTSPGRSSR